jgi:hypothetical protein
VTPGDRGRVLVAAALLPRCRSSQQEDRSRRRQAALCVPAALLRHAYSYPTAVWHMAYSYGGWLGGRCLRCRPQAAAAPRPPPPVAPTYGTAAVRTMMCRGSLVLLLVGSVTAAVPGARRPWRYQDHHTDQITKALPCATSSGQVSCPAPATGCCVAQYSPANKTGCLVPAVATPSGKGCKPPCHHPGTTCCTPGAPLPLSSALKNVLVFGDSVSIDYTRYVKQNLSDIALVQHAPWDTSDGGAGSTSFMVNCLEVFMRHANGTIPKWDLIVFNSGLHNLVNSTEGLAAYQTQLGLIVSGLRKLQPQATLVWAVTTPFMPDKTKGDMAVEQQNALAAKIMGSNHIPSIDLYSRVIAKCGKVYKKCDICDDESKYHPGIYCGYHYTGASSSATVCVIQPRRLGTLVLCELLCRRWIRLHCGGCQHSYTYVPQGLGEVSPGQGSTVETLEGFEGRRSSGLWRLQLCGGDGWRCDLGTPHCYCNYTVLLLAL